MTEIRMDTPSPTPSPVRPAAHPQESPIPPSSPTPASSSTSAPLGSSVAPSRAASKRRTSFASSDDDDGYDHTSLVRTLALRKNLSNENELELDRFSRVSCTKSELATGTFIHTVQLRASQQRIMLHAATLSIKQALDAQHEVAKFQITPEIETNIAKYCAALLFSAHTSVYKDNASQIVLAAMRNGKVALPSKADVGRVDVVLARIGSKLIERRAALKDRIKIGVENKNDIATLTSDIVSGASVQVTVELYHRIAWLRTVGPEIGFAKRVFWDDVDVMLQRARDKFDGDKYERYFRSTFRKDEEAYGKASAGVALVLQVALPEHQKLVDKASLSSAATALPRQTRKPRPKKTKLTAVETPATPTASSSASDPAVGA